MNPIEHLWEMLDHQVQKHRYSNKAVLFKSLNEEWDKIPPACVNRLFKSMPHHCAVITAKGVSMKY